MQASIRPVVIGFDFSHSARPALQRGLALAVAAPLHVLHVVCAIDRHAAIPAVPTDGAIDYLYAERVERALTDDIMRELVREDSGGRVNFCVHVRIGKPAEELLAVARDVGADLIIVGSKPISALQQLVLGSVSAEVAREAGCSVEIARAKRYPDVVLAEIVEIEPHHDYVPPHRYTYDEHRLTLRPRDWPLY